MDQVLDLILWYLLLAAIGSLALPIAQRFLGALPDRGYAFARPLGLLLWGFLFWILSSFGLLENSRGGLFTSLLLFGALSFWAWRVLPTGELRQWLSANRTLILTVEVLFLVAFIFMAWLRATIPVINHTEQPMELAFINAILRSPNMPPHDPWLSGFSISYYYFGYLMIAMLAKLVGVIGSIAFNFGFISVFAMAAASAYGLLYNLLMLYKPRARKALLWVSLLAPVMVLLMGNAQALLEIAYSRHLFWRVDTAAQANPPAPDAVLECAPREVPLTSGFWDWMDIKDLTCPPSGEPTWQPRYYGTGYWWWWRSSRVINDRTFAGAEQELIDEFPAFSYTLGDLHPHVLSMPFVMLAMGLALNLYLGGAEGKRKLPLLDLEIGVHEFAFAAVLIGALAFLNIWDLPIYLILLSGAYTLRRISVQPAWQSARDFATLLASLGAAALLLYMPFYIGFTSQAAGIMPNLLNPTRGAHLWVMFGFLFIPIFIYLVYLWRKEFNLRRLLLNLLIGFAFVAAVWLFSLALGWLYAGASFLYQVLFHDSSLSDAILYGLGAPDVASIFRESFSRRFANSGGWITLSILLGLLVGLLFRKPEPKTKQSTPPSAQTFVLLLGLVGVLLVIAPEFVYLRDQFGTRMNTAFKFFFQAWQMWAILGSFAIYVLLSELRGLGRAALASLFTLLIAAGLIYPLFAFSDISRRPPNQPLTWDGAIYIAPDVRVAFDWLRAAPLGTVAEAVGGSYDASFARYSAHSGQPTVMGWPGHEGQWRGGDVDFARINDIEDFYSTQSWSIAQAIIEKYDIEYVVVGEWERSAYLLNEAKFQQHLDLVFQNGTVSIYQVP
jgi:YYY domain-containing protein